MHLKKIEGLLKQFKLKDFKIINNKQKIFDSLEFLLTNFNPVIDGDRLENHSQDIRFINRESTPILAESKLSDMISSGVTKAKQNTEKNLISDPERKTTIEETPYSISKNINFSNNKGMSSQGKEQVIN